MCVIVFVSVFVCMYVCIGGSVSHEKPLILLTRKTQTLIQVGTCGQQRLLGESRERVA